MGSCPSPTRRSPARRLRPACRWSTTPRSRGSGRGRKGPAATAARSWRPAQDILGRLVSPEDVAAIVFEPIQGEGGYFPPPRPSSAACARSATSTASSSSPTRSSRAWAAPGGCGPWSGTASSRTWRPSPRASRRACRSAFIGREKLFTWEAGAHGSTFAGNPVRLRRRAGHPRPAGRRADGQRRGHGRRLRAGVEYASEECGVVRDIRGKGLMLGVEFASHGESNAVELAASSAGLLILECGEASIRFCPPLMVDETAVDTAIALYAEALRRSAVPSARDRGCTRPRLSHAGKVVPGGGRRRPRPRRRPGRDRGVHPPHLVRGRPRDHPPGPPRPDPRPADPGPGLRPDGGRRLRPQAHLLVAREPGVGSLPRHPPRDRERRPRDRGVQPLRDGGPIRGGGGASPLLPAPLYAGSDLPAANPLISVASPIPPMTRSPSRPSTRT